MRRERFRVVDFEDPRGFNGVNVATVVIEQDGGRTHCSASGPCGGSANT